MQPAFLAPGSTCLADVTSVQDEPVVGNGDVFGRNILSQFLLDTERGGATVGNQAEPVADTEHMGVDSHGSFVEYDRLDDVGCLTAYSGQFDELVQCVGNLTVEVLDQHLGHTYQMLGFVVGIGHAAYVVEDNFGRCCSQCFGGREVAKQRRRYQVDTLVGALCRKYDGYQQFERIAVVQFGFGYWAVLAKPS